jgi:hypothetical protein
VLKAGHSELYSLTKLSLLIVASPSLPPTLGTMVSTLMPAPTAYESSRRLIAIGLNGDGSFARDNIESAIDFGYRAVHLTTVYSKEVVKAYYGKAASYSYWNGCSAGGKQGKCLYHESVISFSTELLYCTTFV